MFFATKNFPFGVRTISWTAYAVNIKAVMISFRKFSYFLQNFIAADLLLLPTQEHPTS